MNILGIIPARGGSKGIPHKNLVACGGKPLVCWTLEAVQDSQLINYAVLSSDAKDILAWAGGKTMAMQRPSELAQDTSSTESVVNFVLDGLEPTPEIIVLLQPTSPVRSGYQIDEAITLLREHEYDAVVSVVPSHAFLWWQHAPAAPLASYNLDMRPRRQDLPPQYEENGSIYVFTKELWDKHHNRLGGDIGLYVMPQECGPQIDTFLDLEICDFLLKRSAWKESS